MPKLHEVREGESLIGIAEAYGFVPETVWNDPANAELRKRRKFLNLLMPGDVVAIPDLCGKVVACQTGKVHKFRRLGVPARFRLRLLTDGEPRRSLAYTLVIGEREIEGTTDANGVLEQFVPPGASQALLYLADEDEPYEVSFDSLAPAEEIRGIRRRLANLGFGCPPSGDELDEPLREALAAFQRRHDLPVTGEPDKTTTGLLTEIHDGLPPQERGTTGP